MSQQYRDRTPSRTPPANMSSRPATVTPSARRNPVAAATTTTTTTPSPTTTTTTTPAGVKTRPTPAAHVTTGTTPIPTTVPPTAKRKPMTREEMLLPSKKDMDAIKSMVSPAAKAAASTRPTPVARRVTESVPMKTMRSRTPSPNVSIETKKPAVEPPSPTESKTPSSATVTPRASRLPLRSSASKTSTNVDLSPKTSITAKAKPAATLPKFKAKMAAKSPSPPPTPAPPSPPPTAVTTTPPTPPPPPKLLPTLLKSKTRLPSAPASPAPSVRTSKEPSLASVIASAVTSGIVTPAAALARKRSSGLREPVPKTKVSDLSAAETTCSRESCASIAKSKHDLHRRSLDQGPHSPIDASGQTTRIAVTKSNSKTVLFEMDLPKATSVGMVSGRHTVTKGMAVMSPSSQSSTSSTAKVSNTSLPGKRLSKLSTEVEGSKLPSPKRKTPSEEERLRLKQQLPPPQTQPSFTGSDKSNRSVPAKSAPTSREKTMGERQPSGERHTVTEKKQRTSYSQDQLQQAKIQLRQQHLLQIQQAARQAELKSKTSVKKSTSRVSVDSNKLKQGSVSSKDDAVPKQHTKRSSLSLVDEPPVRMKSKHSSLSVNEPGKQTSKGSLTLKDKNKATDETAQVKSPRISNTVQKTSSKMLKPVGDHPSDKSLNSKDVVETENAAPNAEIVLVMSPADLVGGDENLSIEKEDLCKSGDVISDDVCSTKDDIEVSIADKCSTKDRVDICIADKGAKVVGFVDTDRLMPKLIEARIATTEELLRQDSIKVHSELVLTKDDLPGLLVTRPDKECLEPKGSTKIQESGKINIQMPCPQSLVIDDELPVEPSVSEGLSAESKDISQMPMPHSAIKEKEIATTPTTEETPLVDTVLAFSGMATAMEQMEQIKAWPLDIEMQANVEENRLLGFSKDIPAGLVKLSDKTKESAKELNKMASHPESIEKSQDTMSDLSMQYRDIPPTIITDNLLLTSETSVATILSGISAAKKDDLLDNTDVQFREKTVHVEENEDPILLEVPKPCLQDDGAMEQEIIPLIEEASKKLILSQTSDLMQCSTIQGEDKLSHLVANLQPSKKSPGDPNIQHDSKQNSVTSSPRDLQTSPSGQSNGWSPIIFEQNKSKSISSSPIQIKTVLSPFPILSKDGTLIASDVSLATPPLSTLSINTAMPIVHSPPQQSSLQSIGLSPTQSQLPSRPTSPKSHEDTASTKSTGSVCVTPPEAEVTVSFGLNTPYQHLIRAERKVETGPQLPINRINIGNEKSNNNIESQAVGSNLVIGIMQPSGTQIQGSVRVSPRPTPMQGQYYVDAKRHEDAYANLNLKDRGPKVALSNESKKSSNMPHGHLADLTMSGPRSVSSAPQRNTAAAVYKSAEFEIARRGISPEPKQVVQTSTDSFIGVIAQEIARPPPAIQIPLIDTTIKSISQKSGDGFSLEKQLASALSFKDSLDQGRTDDASSGKNESRESAFTPVMQVARSTETVQSLDATQEGETTSTSQKIFGSADPTNKSSNNIAANADKISILTPDMQTAMDDEKSRISSDNENVEKMPFEEEKNKSSLDDEKIATRAAFGDYVRPTTDELKLDLTGLQTEQDDDDDNDEKIYYSKSRDDQKLPMTFGEIHNQLMQRNMFGPSTTALTTMHKEILSALFAALSAGSLTPEEMSDLSLALDASPPGSMANTAELNQHHQYHSQLETQSIRHETIMSLSNKKQGLMLALTNALSIGVMSTELHTVMAALSRSQSLEQQSLAHHDPKSTMSLDASIRPSYKDIKSVEIIERSDNDGLSKELPDEIMPMDLLSDKSREKILQGEESLEASTESLFPAVPSEELLLKILSPRASTEQILSPTVSPRESSENLNLSVPRIQDSYTFSIDQKLDMVGSSTVMPAEENRLDEVSSMNQQLVSALTSALSVGKMSHKLQDVLTVLSLTPDDSQASTVGNMIGSFASLPQKLSNLLSALAPNPPEKKLTGDKIVDINPSEKESVIIDDATDVQEIEKGSDVNEMENGSDSNELEDEQEEQVKTSDSNVTNLELESSADAKMSIGSIQEQVLSDVVDLPETETDVLSALTASLAVPLQTALTIISADGSQQVESRESLSSSNIVLDITTSPSSANLALDTPSMANMLETSLIIDDELEVEQETDGNSEALFTLLLKSGMSKSLSEPEESEIEEYMTDVKLASSSDVEKSESIYQKALSVLTAHAQETSAAKEISEEEKSAETTSLPEYFEKTYQAQLKEALPMNDKNLVKPSLSPQQKEIVNALSLSSQNALSKLNQTELSVGAPTAQAGDASSISITKPSDLGSENKDGSVARQGSQQPNAVSAFSVSNKNIPQTELVQPTLARDVQERDDGPILSANQQDVLVALSAALDAGKLTKELHDALSSLCVGKNSPLQQDALTALSSLLSPFQSPKQPTGDVSGHPAANESNQPSVADDIGTTPSVPPSFHSLPQPTAIAKNNQNFESSLSVGEEPIWHQVRPGSWSIAECMYPLQGREGEKPQKQHVEQPLFFVKEETAPVFDQEEKILVQDQIEGIENKLVAAKPPKKTEKTNEAFTLANYDIFLRNQLELSSTEEDNVIITTIKDINELPILEDKDRSTTSSVSGSELLTPFLLSPFVFSPTTSRDTSSSLQTTETLPTLDHGRLVAQLTAFDQTPESEQSLSVDASLSSPTGSQASSYPDADDTAAVPTIKQGGVFKQWRSAGKQIQLDNATDEGLSSKNDSSQQISSKDGTTISTTVKSVEAVDENINAWSATSTTTESITTAPASWSTVYHRYGAIQSRDEMQGQVQYLPSGPGTQEQPAMFAVQPPGRQENQREFLTVSDWKDEDNLLSSEHYYVNVRDTTGRSHQAPFIQQSYNDTAVSMMSTNQTEMVMSGPQYTQATNIHVPNQKSTVQSIPAASECKGQLQNSVPPVTKLRADATPFVHVPSSKPVPQSNSNTQVPITNVWQSPKITNQQTQAQLQAQANLRQQQQIISNLMTQELLVPYTYDRSQYLANNANYQSSDSNNTRQQIFGNWDYQSHPETQTTSSFGSNNDGILEPVAITHELGESGYWSSNDSRSIGNNNQMVFDMPKSADGDKPITADSSQSSMVSSIRLETTQITEDGRSVTLTSSVPVEHFFSLVDVTLTPPFVPNIPNDLLNAAVDTTAANESIVPARALIPGSYITQNESIDSQLDGTEIPPPRNEHLFSQIKDTGGNAISSTLTLGKEFSGEMGVVGTLLNYETDQTSAHDESSRKRHISDADVESAPAQSFGDVAWRPQGIYREHYQQGREQKNSKQNVELSLHSIKEVDWPCADVQRVSAEEFYNEQENIAVWSGNTEVSDDGKMIRISVEDFLQQVNDPSQRGKREFFTPQELNFSDESRMSAEDFFQVCRVKASQVPEVSWPAGDTGFAQIPALTLSYDLASELSAPSIDDTYGQFSQVGSQYVDAYGALQGPATTYHPIPQAVNDVFHMSSQQSFWQGEQLPEKAISVSSRASYQQNNDAFESLSINGPSKIILDTDTTMSALDDREHSLMREEMRRQSAEQFFQNKFGEGSPYHLAFLRPGSMSVSHDDLHRQSAEQFFQNGGHRFPQSTDNYFTKTYRQSSEQLYQKPSKVVKSSLADDSGRIVVADDSYHVQQAPDGSVYVTSDDSYLFQQMTDVNAFINDNQALPPDDGYRQSAEQFYKTGELRQQMAAFSQQTISSDDSYRISTEQYFSKPKNEEKFARSHRRSRDVISDGRSEDVSIISIGSVDERSQIRATGSNDTITSEDDQSAGLSRSSLQKDDYQIERRSPLHGREFLDLGIHINPSWETVGLKSPVEQTNQVLQQPSAIREITENDTQTDQVLVIALDSGFFDEDMIKKADIEERLKKLVEVELMTILAQVKPDSLMLVAESSVVELLNRFREMNSQQSLVELRSASSTPRSSPSPSQAEVTNDEEAIITVVAAANLQHSAAYRLERFLETFNYSHPIDHFVSVHSTMEGTVQSEPSIGEITNVLGVVEGSPVSELPLEMLTTIVMTEEAIQTEDSFLTKKKKNIVAAAAAAVASESESDESDDAVNQLTEEKEEESEGGLEDIAEEDPNYISVDTSEGEVDEEVINNVIASDKAGDNNAQETIADKVDVMSDDIILAVEKAVNDAKETTEGEEKCVDVNGTTEEVISVDRANIYDIDDVEVSSTLSVDIMNNDESATPGGEETYNITPTDVVKKISEEPKEEKLLPVKAKKPIRPKILDEDTADIEGLILDKKHVTVDELLEHVPQDDDEEDEALTAITIYKGRTLDLLSSDDSGEENAKSASFEPDSALPMPSVHAFQIATPVSSTITVQEFEVDHESVSQQQLAVPKRDTEPKDDWQTQQNEHVTGFCLIEQPALLTRERIRAIRRRFDRQQQMIEENCSRLKDLIRFEEILAANSHWRRSPTSPPLSPRNESSSSENNSRYQQTPTPSPRRRSLISPIDLARTIHPEEPSTWKNDDDDKRRHDKRKDESRQPTLYLRLPSLPSTNNLSTTSSSPTASPRGKQSPRLSNQDMVARDSTSSSEESNAPWSSSAAKSSPVSWESLATSKKTPEAASPRKSRSPSPVPRRRFKSQSPGDKSPTPSPRSFQRSPSRTRNGGRSPSPMPRTKTPDLQDSRCTLNHAISDTWSPTPLPRMSPSSRNNYEEDEDEDDDGNDNELSSTSKKELEPEAVSSRSKSSQWESNPWLALYKTEDEIAPSTQQQQQPTTFVAPSCAVEINLQMRKFQSQQPLALPPADPVSAKDAKSLDQMAEDELSQLAVPQESTPFLVDLISPSTSPSPPAMETIPESTSLTLPEGASLMIPEGTPVTLNYQLTIPPMTSPLTSPMTSPIASPIPKSNSLKLTKNQLLNPKFLLELLTPPSMLHSKSKDSKPPPPRQWRIPSPLPLNWILPQSRQTRTPSPPEIVNQLPPLPPSHNRRSPPGASWTLQSPTNDVWQLTLPSLHQQQQQPPPPQQRPPPQPPLIDSVLGNQSPINIGSDSPTWHPPSPTPLPEGAVTPAPLAMAVKVENRTVDERRMNTPSPWTLRPASSPPIVERRLQTSPITERRPTSPPQIDNRLPSPAMVDIRRPSPPIVDRRPPSSPTFDRQQSTERKLSPPHSACSCGQSRKRSVISDNPPSSSEDLPPTYIDRSPSLSRRVLSGRRSSVPQQNRGSRNQLLDRRSPSPTHITSCPLATDFCTVWNQQPPPPSRSQLNAQRTTSRHQLSVQKSTSRHLLTARPAMSRHSNEQCCHNSCRHQQDLDQRPSSPRQTRQRPTQPYDSTAYNQQQLTCPTCLRPPTPPSPPICNCRPRSPPPPSYYTSPPPSPRTLSPTNSMDLTNANNLYTLVINDEQTDDSDDEDVRAMTPEEILQNQLLLADPGLSDEDDADAIAIALQAESPPVFYNQCHQQHQIKRGSQVYGQPIHIQMHALGSMSGLAERIAFSRTVSPTRYVPEVTASHHGGPIRRLPAIEGINSDSDDDVDGRVDLETIHVPIPPSRVLGVNPFYGLYPFARF